MSARGVVLQRREVGSAVEKREERGGAARGLTIIPRIRNGASSFQKHEHEHEHEHERPDCGSMQSAVEQLQEPILIRPTNGGVDSDVPLGRQAAGRQGDKATTGGADQVLHATDPSVLATCNPLVPKTTPGDGYGAVRVSSCSACCQRLCGLSGVQRALLPTHTGV